MKRRFLLLTLVMVIMLVGCSKKNKDETDDKENDAERNEVGENNDQSSEPTSVSNFPFTGIETSEGAKNRPVGVMVNNHPVARPQSGLSQADIVFEILAESTITRFLALFQSEQPDVVGPVRSAREYYFELASGYDALYVYHGAATFINEMIESRGIEHLNGSIYDNDGTLFKRESFRQAPHNSYLQFHEVYDVAGSKGYDTETFIEPLPFLEKEETISGESASHVEILYKGRNPNDTVEFLYDQETEQYTRSESQEETVELNTEDPIQMDNVFIIETHHEVIDDAGRRKIDFQAGGNAYLIQKGNIQEVEWINEDGRIIPVKDGQPVGFVPGKTWINVIPSNPGMEQSVKISNESIS